MTPVHLNSAERNLFNRKLEITKAKEFRKPGNRKVATPHLSISQVELPSQTVFSSKASKQSWPLMRIDIFILVTLNQPVTLHVFGVVPHQSSPHLFQQHPWQFTVNWPFFQTGLLLPGLWLADSNVDFLVQNQV